jgi:hypothetical protein
VEDNQPVGARFTVELPALLENEPPPPAAETEMKPSVVKL